MPPAHGHVATFVTHVQDATGADMPQFVKVEFHAFLECGILAHGFLRLRCGDCGHDKLVAFSCKGRGFCPSCGARRMAQTAANLVDHVISARAGAPVGAGAAHSLAVVVGVASRAAHAGAGGRAPGDHRIPARVLWSLSRSRPTAARSR